MDKDGCTESKLSELAIHLPTDGEFLDAIVYNVKIGNHLIGPQQSPTRSLDCVRHLVRLVLHTNICIQIIITLMRI